MSEDEINELRNWAIDMIDAWGCDWEELDNLHGRLVQFLEESRVQRPTNASAPGGSR